MLVHSIVMEVFVILAMIMILLGDGFFSRIGLVFVLLHLSAILFILMGGYSSEFAQSEIKIFPSTALMILIGNNIILLTLFALYDVFKYLIPDYMRGLIPKLIITFYAWTQVNILYASVIGLSKLKRSLIIHQIVKRNPLQVNLFTGGNAHGSVFVCDPHLLHKITSPSIIFMYTIISLSSLLYQIHQNIYLIILYVHSPIGFLMAYHIYKVVNQDREIVEIINGNTTLEDLIRRSQRTEESTFGLSAFIKKFTSKLKRQIGLIAVIFLPSNTPSLVIEMKKHLSIPTFIALLIIFSIFYMALHSYTKKRTNTTQNQRTREEEHGNPPQETSEPEHIIQRFMSDNEQLTTIEEIPEIPSPSEIKTKKQISIEVKKLQQRFYQVYAPSPGVKKEELIGILQKHVRRWTINPIGVAEFIVSSLGEKNVEEITIALRKRGVPVPVLDMYNLLEKLRGDGYVMVITTKPTTIEIPTPEIEKESMQEISSLEPIEIPGMDIFEMPVPKEKSKVIPKITSLQGITTEISHIIGKYLDRNQHLQGVMLLSREDATILLSMWSASIKSRSPSLDNIALASYTVVFCARRISEDLMLGDLHEITIESEYGSIIMSILPGDLVLVALFEDYSPTSLSCFTDLKKEIIDVLVELEG